MIHRCVAGLVGCLCFAQTGLAQLSPLKRAELEGVQSWAFALGLGAAELDTAQPLLAQYDLVVVDGEVASAEQIAALKSSGAIVLGYLSVGTIERGRAWFRRAKPYRLDFWGDWGEWYADTSAPEYRVLMRRVAARLLRKGFSGLFLDNVDMISDHRGQARGMRRLVRKLAEAVHAGSGFLFAQNGDEIMTPLLPVLDGWNREDLTYSYDFDAEQYAAVSDDDHAAALSALRAIRAEGVLTLATDYLAAGSDAAAAIARENACGVGAVSFVSDIDLTRMPSPPAQCG